MYKNNSMIFFIFFLYIYIYIYNNVSTQKYANIKLYHIFICRILIIITIYCIIICKYDIIIIVVNNTFDNITMSNVLSYAFFNLFDKRF